METTSKNIGLLFMGILVIIIWGFYQTFFRLFSSFHSSNLIQHLHEIALLFWFLTLMAQPVLIHYKKFAAQKTLKRFSLFLAPLVMFAIFYMAKEQYLQ